MNFTGIHGQGAPRCALRKDADDLPSLLKSAWSMELNTEERDDVQVEAKPTEGVRPQRRMPGKAEVRSVVSYIKLMVFLSVVAVVYIWMRNYSIKLWREEKKLENEVTNLHYEVTTLTSQRMVLSKETEVVRLVQERNLGLEEPSKPPVRLELADE